MDTEKDWISIDERRPDPQKDGADILITREINLKFTGKTFYITQADRIYEETDGTIRLGSGNGWAGVTAWRPFPIPYQREEEQVT